MGRERREHNRSLSFARVLILIDGRVGYVADMSPGGFRGLFLDGSTFIPGSRLKLKMAFSEKDIDPFDLEVLVRWSDFDVGAVEAGFELCAEPSGEAQRDFDAIEAYYTENRS
jgi:hypothetical protein